MARGATLVALLNDLRAACRLSLNPAHNVQARDAQVALLQRTQNWLWEDFDWPHLRNRRQYAAQAGQRYYDFGTDFDIDRIEKVRFKTNGAWLDLAAGIGPEHFVVWDSDLDQRSWPIRRWRIHEGEQAELWPISDQNGDPDTFDGYIEVTGIRRLRPLVDDGDRADLDDQLIVRFAAAEFLAAQGAKDVQLVQQLANKRYAKLRGGLMPRRRFRMFGTGSDDRCARRPMIANYRPPVS